MEYQELNPAQRRELVRQNLDGLERQHYTQVLSKLAQPGNDAAQRTLDATIARLEESIGHLRDEARQLDEQIAQKAAPPGPATPGALSPLQEQNPHVEAPAPATTFSAVHGDLSESQPGNDAPAS